MKEATIITFKIKSIQTSTTGDTICDENTLDED